MQKWFNLYSESMALHKNYKITIKVIVCYGNYVKKEKHKRISKERRVPFRKDARKSTSKKQPQASDSSSSEYKGVEKHTKVYQDP